MANITITDDYISEMIAAVRVSETDTSIQEVTDLIQAAVVDLVRQGVDTVNLDEPSTKQAIKLYVKGYYGYDDGSRFQTAYEKLSAAMSLSSDYEGGDPDE